MTDEEAQIEIIKRFKKFVYGKTPDVKDFTEKHDGKEGHWLEVQMGKKADASNDPDFFGYEMKNATKNKTSFGDWSAQYYIFKDEKYGISRDEFMEIFGAANNEKHEGRYSWSGTPVPKIGKCNDFGQILIVTEEGDILAKYNFEKDQRKDKKSIVPINLQKNDLLIAKWDHEKIKEKVENKFNQRGWFKCLKNKYGIYTQIVFGSPITFETWINSVRKGDIFFDSGMHQGNSRNYSQWRALNNYWDNLVISKH